MNDRMQVYRIIRTDSCAQIGSTTSRRFLWCPNNKIGTAAGLRCLIDEFP